MRIEVAPYRGGPAGPFHRVKAEVAPFRAAGVAEVRQNRAEEVRPPVLRTVRGRQPWPCAVAKEQAALVVRLAAVVLYLARVLPVQEAAPRACSR
jgi:hypothetical protein